MSEVTSVLRMIALDRELRNERRFNYGNLLLKSRQYDYILPAANRFMPYSDFTSAVKHVPMMEMLMPRCVLPILSMMFLTMSAGSVISQQNSGTKTVRLAWFPRFSPDSKLLITAHGSWNSAEGGEVRVWDAATGESKFVIPTDRGIRTVQWDPNGNFFAAGGYDNVARIYDATTGKETSQIKFPGTVESLQITPDSKWLITAHGGGSVRITEIASKRRVHEWGAVHKGGIWNCKLSRDGKRLATAGKDQFVRVFDLATFKILFEFPHPGETNGLTFTRDGNSLLTGCSDAMVRVYGLLDGTQTDAFMAHDSGGVTDMQLSPDGKTMATCGIDRSVRLWDMSVFDRPQLVATLDSHNDAAFGVTISNDSKWVASAGWDGEIKVWDLATRKEQWAWAR